MPQEPTVKYQYAIGPAENVVNVHDLSKTIETRNSIFYCLSCGKLLRPVLGEKRQKHFRHTVETNCSVETYLHKLAKRLFFQVYKECLETKTPFELELLLTNTCSTCQDKFEILCKLDPTPQKYNLAKLFPGIELEAQDGAFIPDILLSNQHGEKLYVEFAVTHISSDQKKESGVRIIEITLETEDDLHFLHAKLISEKENTVRLFNFRDIVKAVDNRATCKSTFSFFLLKADGGAFILHGTPFKFQKRLKWGDIEFSKLLPHGGPDIYFEELEKAYYDKRKIRNCFLCRYHGENLFRDDNEGPIYCKFLKKKFVSTQAVECEYYRPDPKAFPSQTKEGNGNLNIISRML